MDSVWWVVIIEAVIIGWLVHHMLKIDTALDFILPDALERIKRLEDNNDQHST